MPRVSETDATSRPSKNVPVPSIAIGRGAGSAGASAS
jgi:hypothetical protein